MLQIVEMDHIVLNVRDVERSLQFYTNVLGLESERVEEFRSGKVGFPSVRINGDTIVDLFPPERHASVANAGMAGNLNHFCLVMANADMKAVIDYLAEQGVEIQGAPTRPWGARGLGTSIRFRDPDDNLIELRTYAAVADVAMAAGTAAAGA